MKRLFLAQLIFTFSLPLLPAATVWTETESRLDETIADTNTLPAVSMMQPLLAKIPFSSFRYPHVDQNENVTFIADDPVYGGRKAHGIYRSVASSGELQTLLRAGESTVPGTSVPLVWFRGLQMDGLDFVVNATDREKKRGLYYWSNGALRTIARSDFTILPGSKQPLTDVEYGALVDGRILYNAQAGDENLLALYSVRDGQVRVISRTGVPIPGQPGEVFRYFSKQNWLDHNSIVFRAASVTNPHERSNGKRGVYGWFNVDWNQPDKSLGAERLQTLADGSSRVPLVNGGMFDDFRSAPISGNLIAFVGGGANFSGVYYRDLASKDAAIRPIVDTQSELQGLFQGPFTNFAIFPSVFDKSIVFVGYAADDYVGVFLYRTDRDELFLLTDNRTKMGEKKIKDFEIAGHFLVRNRFAVSAEFEDKTYGVYMATIPRRSFKRMVTPGN